MQLSYYPQSDQVTHDLLQKFYHGLILHRRFIMERMLDSELLKQIRIERGIYNQLKSLPNEFEYNIARLYHLVRSIVLHKYTVFGVYIQTLFLLYLLCCVYSSTLLDVIACQMTAYKLINNLHH